MRRLILIPATLFSIGVFADTIPAHMFVDFETSTDGMQITGAIVNAATHSSIGGSWVTLNDPEGEGQGSVPNMTISTAASFPLFTPVVVGGVTYSNPGSRGMRVVTPVGGENTIRMDFAGPTNPDSIGFNFRWNGPNINSSNRDIVRMYGPGGDFQILDLTDAEPEFHAHYQPPFTGLSPGTQFVRGRWYWVTMVHVAGGNTFRVRFYDTTTGYTLVGEETGPIGTSPASSMTRLQFGAVKYNAGSSQSYDFDNIIVNTDGIFPLGPGNGQPDLVASSNRVDWTQCGIPGGIPNRTTIFTNFTSAPTRAALQNALDVCPSNNVVLFTGNVNVGSTGLQIGNNGVVLRGTNNAMIIGDDNGGLGHLTLFSAAWSGQTATINLFSGYTKGSSNIVMSATNSNVKVGSVVVVNQTQDGTFVLNAGNNGPRADIGVNGDVNRVLAQSVEVMAKPTGTNLTIWPPLNWTYDAARTPQLFVWTSSQNLNYITMAGVENITISNTSPNALANIYLNRASMCWVSNVTSLDGGFAHILLRRCFRPEIRRSTFDRVISTVTSQGYGTLFEYQTCSGRFEDNIGKNLRTMLEVNSGSSGNAVLYNYVTNVVQISSPANSFAPNASGHHSCHAMMTLWEGNVIEGKWSADFTWGTSSHGLLCRNWFYGAAANLYAHQSGSAITIGATNSFYQIVGNILGMSTLAGNTNWTTRSSLKISPASMAYDNEYATFRIGYFSEGGDAGGGNNSTSRWNQFVVGGNYDYVSNAIAWYNPPTAVTVPDSYIYTSKPSWFGTNRWPAIDPLATPMTSFIPAQTRLQTPSSPSVPLITSATNYVVTNLVAMTAYQITADQSITTYSATPLANGLSVDIGTGIISGTPNIANSTVVTNITLGATNSNGGTTTNLALTVTALGTPVINSATTHTGTNGVPLASYRIAATQYPTTFGASGLPTGLSVSQSSGLITGTPTQDGVFIITLTATNDVPASDTETLTLTIATVVPTIFVSPNNLAYEIPESTTFDQVFGVTNTGSASSTLTGNVYAAASPFSIVAPTNFSLAGGTGTNVTIRYSPLAKGTNGSTWVVTSNGGNQTNTLSGNAYPMAIGNTMLATNMLIFSPYVINAGANYISQPSSTAANPLTGGRAVYGITIATTGLFSFTGDCQANTLNDDSSYFAIDAEAVFVVDQWFWQGVPISFGSSVPVIIDVDGGPPPTVPPHLFSLSAGTHKIVLRGRETGQLRSITISEQTPTFVRSGSGDRGKRSHGDGVK